MTDKNARSRNARSRNASVVTAVDGPSFVETAKMFGKTR